MSKKKKQLVGLAEVNSDSEPLKIRESIKPTFDSRKTGPAYNVSTFLNDKPLDFMKPIEDPFVHTTIRIGWIDMVKGLLKRRLEVRVNVYAFDNDRVEDVMELDANYLSVGSTRRQEWNAHINQEIEEHIVRETGED